MDHAQEEDAREARANELYWESDESVNQIADELDLSKSTLYGLIHPLAADVACPRCGAGMEYPNRTARDRGLVTCPACGHEADEDDALEPAPASGSADARRRLPASADPARAARERVLAGTALLAAAAGFLLGRLTRRS